MLRSYDALVVAKGDQTEALRLLSAVVMGWDLLPVEDQGRLIRDTCLIDGELKLAALSLPVDVLAFIARHKDRPVWNRACPTVPDALDQQARTKLGAG